MSNKEFINNLSSTYADVRRLDVKKINLKGKNILEYIEESVPTITHSQDTREIVTENDLWGQWVETKDDGTVVVHDDEVTNPNSSNDEAWLSNVKAVQDNKAYSEITSDADDNFTGVVESSVLANIQTEMIKNGNSMFNGTSLKSFSANLSSLVNGQSMFGVTSLTSFSGDLSNLVNGYRMFTRTSLASFSGDLSNLVNGEGMFGSCTNLTSFSSNLSSLMNGFSMFGQCSLDAQSVMYIADSIKDIITEKQLYIDGIIPYVTLSDNVYSASKGFMEDGQYAFTYNNPQPYTITIHASGVGQLTLGINVTNDANTIQQQLEDFAKEAYFDSWAELKQEFVDKGWTVTFQYGGTGTSITYGLRDGEQIIPCSIFAKLVEADKDSAEYCTEDASTFYNIEWGHDVTDSSSYTQFNSLEDAMASWNVFPKENIITTEE